jgi:hypothetical protein
MADVVGFNPDQAVFLGALQDTRVEIRSEDFGEEGEDLKLQCDWHVYNSSREGIGSQGNLEKMGARNLRIGRKYSSKYVVIQNMTLFS